MARLRYNGLTATLGGTGLDATQTSITFTAGLTHSGGLSVPTLAGSDYISLTILGSTGNVAEIVSLTAYTSGATTGTIARGREGTTAVVHAPGDSVVHSPTTADFGTGNIDDPATWTASLGYDEEFNVAGSALPTGWAWTNQGTASYVCKYGAGILTDPSSATDQARIIDRALPTEATWEATFKMTVVPTPAPFHAAFVVLRESSTGKLVLFGPQTSNTPTWRREIYYWTNATTASAPQLEVADALAPAYRYWRIRRNSATSWDFEFSFDGMTWASMSAARNISTFMTPDRIGFAVYRNGQNAAASLDWFRVR